MLTVNMVNFSKKRRDKMEVDDLATDLLSAFGEIRKMNHFNVKDFGPAEMHVGHILIEHEKSNNPEPLNAKTIAEMTKMSRPVLSRVMKNLEQKEMVERIVPKHNHRIVQYVISKKGKDLLVEGARQMHQKTKELIKLMGKDNALQLIKSIQLLNLSIKQLKEKKG